MLHYGICTSFIVNISIDFINEVLRCRNNYTTLTHKITTNAS